MENDDLVSTYLVPVDPSQKSLKELVFDAKKRANELIISASASTTRVKRLLKRGLACQDLESKDVAIDVALHHLDTRLEVFIAVIRKAEGFKLETLELENLLYPPGYRLDIEDNRPKN